MSVTASWLTKHSGRLRRDFELDGYVFVPRFATGSELGLIQRRKFEVLSDVWRIVPAEDIYLEDPSEKSSIKQLQRLNVHDEFFRELADDGKWRQLAEICLGTSAAPVNMQYFDKKPSGSSAPTPPHQDGFYFDLKPNHGLTIWMALEDVEPEQGCLHYVPGSHHHGMRWHSASGTKGFSQGIVDFPTTHEIATAREFPCKAGDVLAHHSLTVHWADENQTVDRGREALGWVYFASSSRPSASA